MCMICYIEEISGLGLDPEFGPLDSELAWNLRLLDSLLAKNGVTGIGIGSESGYLDIGAALNYDDLNCYDFNVPFSSVSSDCTEVCHRSLVCHGCCHSHKLFLWDVFVCICNRPYVGFSSLVIGLSIPMKMCRAICFCK